MKLKPPLLSRRVRTQPWSRTVLPIASGLRASATVILSIAGVPRLGSWGMSLPPQHSDGGGRVGAGRVGAGRKRLGKRRRRSAVLLVTLRRRHLLRHDQPAG